MNGEYISIESAKIMTDIEKENKELQNRVNKAIKKINILNENLCENTDLQLVQLIKNQKEVLKILKGDKNE